VKNAYLELPNAAFLAENHHIVYPALACPAKVNVLVDSEGVHSNEGALNGGGRPWAGGVEQLPPAIQLPTGGWILGGVRNQAGTQELCEPALPMFWEEALLLHCFVFMPAQVDVGMYPALSLWQ